MRKLLAIAAMLAALLPAFALSPAFGLSPDELLKDSALEHRARALSAQLRCLVCQNQSIDDSDAPLAKDLRTLVREQLSAGKSDEEIMAFVVARYGEFVLLKPRLTPGTILLWGTPFAVLLIAGGALLLRRRRVETAPEMPLTEAERQALHRVTE
jgi:cytochrome c-type biogenesis protein CcmH